MPTRLRTQALWAFLRQNTADLIGVAGIATYNCCAVTNLRQDRHLPTVEVVWLNPAVPQTHP
jgi:hypothetical protein